MDNLEVRESQCKRDIEKLQQELEQIQREKECQPKWKHGDRFINTRYRGAYSNVRVLMNTDNKWNLMLDHDTNLFIQGTTYEACRDYINPRLNGQYDEYKYIDNIFEGKY